MGVWQNHQNPKIVYRTCHEIGKANQHWTEITTNKVNRHLLSRNTQSSQLRQIIQHANTNWFLVIRRSRTQAGAVYHARFVLIKAQILVFKRPTAFHFHTEIHVVCRAAWTHNTSSYNKLCGNWPCKTRMGKTRSGRQWLFVTCYFGVNAKFDHNPCPKEVVEKT